MLVNPHLKQIHPYYYRRIKEAPFNATVISVCAVLGMVIVAFVR